ncbi:MAG: hypothetical protein RBQ91_02185 [Acholeplasma sp.]|nr:hypothetical protein [Acholeplasma sp.]
MESLEHIISNANGSYRHVKRLLELGYTDTEIELIYIEKQFESEVPRRFRRLKLLYSQIFRNLLLMNFDKPDERKKIKQRFFNEWREINLPFTEFIVDELWENIAKEVYLQ